MNVATYKTLDQALFCTLALDGDGVLTEGLGAALLPLASSSSGCTTGIIYTKQTVKKSSGYD